MLGIMWRLRLARKASQVAKRNRLDASAVRRAFMLALDSAEASYNPATGSMEAHVKRHIAKATLTLLVRRAKFDDECRRLAETAVAQFEATRGLTA